MTLTQLRYFQAVCQFSSISKASEELHVSQPAVSIAISNLEEEFGVLLLKRDNRRFEITPAGNVFLNLTNDLLTSVDAMCNQIKALQTDSKKLSLGVASFAYTRVLQPILQKYRSLMPEMQVKVYECSAKEAVLKLRSRQIDVALTVDSSERPSFVEGLSLYKSHSIFAVGNKHPLAEKESCSFADIAGESLIFAKEDSRLTTQVKKRFQEMGVTPNIFLYSAQSNVIEAALESGHDGAIIGDELAQQLTQSVLIPIDNPVIIDHLLLWKKSSHLPQSVSRFIKVVRSFYPEAIDY